MLVYFANKGLLVIFMNSKILFLLLKKYNLTSNEIDEILSIILSIYSHDEFQRRMTDEFCHHDTITLGYHIIEVTIVTYILCKKYENKINLDLALKISMMHDLYTNPWQNNPPLIPDRFFNKHGFRHPIEAVINSSKWYPEIFNMQSDSEIIIDGIIHHMYPLPVRSYVDSSDNKLQLRNFDYAQTTNKKIKQIIIDSSNKFKIDDVSICPSKYKEGKVVCIADKIVSFKNIRTCDIDGIIALFNGKNKSLSKRKTK